MPVDPQVQEMLDVFAAQPLPALREQGPEEARRFMRLVAPSLGIREEVAKVDDRTIPGPAGDIPVRIYSPAGAGPLPVMVFFHGGGWVIGDLETHDRLCRALANAAASVVISVDYRLAPEHRYPAAVEDAYAATLWALANVAELSGGVARVYVGGDSAGGNLAAAVALLARNSRVAGIAYQVLLYPITDRSFDSPSYRDKADGYLLSRDDMMWFWENYLAREEDGLDVYASPLRAFDLSRMPPALVVTAEYDPLCDEGEAYARRLREAGNRVRQIRYDGMIHGFLRRTRSLDRARAAIREIGEILRRELGR